MGKKIRLFPEIIEGLRIQYVDKRSATRSSVVHKRTGNKISVIDGVGRKDKIEFKQIRGYWAKEIAYALDINMTRFNIKPVEPEPKPEKIIEIKKVEKIKKVKIEEKPEKPKPEKAKKTEKPKPKKDEDSKPKTEDDEMMEMF